MRRWRSLPIVVAVVGLVLVEGGTSAATSGAGRADNSARTAAHGSAALADGPYVTLLFSRAEITAADGCVADSAHIARLDTAVAPFLASVGMRATASLTTAVTADSTRNCVHANDSLAASWADAAGLASTYQWSFVSHTATYPANLATLTPDQSWAETCGSAATLDAHGLPGAHGLIAYPGAQPSPTALQTDYGSACFDWGRRYGFGMLTDRSTATTPPYWQNTGSVNGGPCRDMTQPCATIAATGGARYTLPSKVIATVNSLRAGQWMTLQAYILVTGRSPAYVSNATRWDCTDPDPRRHWTNDNERYCYRDWQRIVRAIEARTDITVTDPQAVGLAWGRPDLR